MAAPEALQERAADFLNDLGAGSAAIELPAGCGKTEAAVALTAEACVAGKRVLLLTHTNAGVGAIRHRLTERGVHGQVRVTTIDSFLQRLAASFPTLGPEVTASETDSGYWTQIRSASAAIAAVENVKEVLAGTYDLLLVDEYQDCSVEQHAFVTSLSGRVPIIALGDPLQAIFGFGGNVLVEWDVVTATFPAASPFEIEPHRWSNTNPHLGRWLLEEVRPALVGGVPVDLASAGKCIRVSTADAATKRKAPWLHADAPGSAVFIVSMPWQAEAFAKTTKGRFPVIEDLGMRKVADLARNLDNAASGAAVASSTLKFLLASTTKVAEAVGGGPAAVARLDAGKRFAPRANNPNATFLRGLNSLIEDPSADAILEVLALARQIEGSYCYARERTADAYKVLEIVSRGDRSSYRDAAADVRAHKRFGTRRPNRATAHPGLIKGLEFSVTCVLDAHAFPSREGLYVALTRGSSILHVVSNSHSLMPAD